jgi:hypothetical protein
MSYSRPISTKSELAQKFFDQGLRLVYGYYSPEATASSETTAGHYSASPINAPGFGFLNSAFCPEE